MPLVAAISSFICLVFSHAESVHFLPRTRSLLQQNLHSTVIVGSKRQSGVGVVVRSDRCGSVVVGVGWRLFLGTELEGESLGCP